MSRLFEHLTQALRSRLGLFLLVATLVFFALSGGGLYAILVAGANGLAWLLLAGSIVWLLLMAFVVYGDPPRDGGTGGPSDDGE